MNKQNDSKLAISVVATLSAGIALIYVLIAFSNLVFAVAGVSVIFLICSYILTQNILSFINMKNKSLNVQIKNGMDDLSNQIEGMSSAQTQISKATYLYTRQAAENVATLRGNYAESQEVLHKNLSVLANAQNKSTKLLIKYDQNNTTKLISTLKEIKNNLNETLSSGFDQVKQPNNADVVAMLESIVEYLNSQPANMDQSLSSQINNVARELQNISINIAKVQSVPMPQVMPMQPVMPAAPVYQEMPQPVAAPVTSPAAEVPEAVASIAEPQETEAQVEETPIAETPIEETPAVETPIAEAPIEETPAVETPIAEAPIEEAPVEEQVMTAEPLEAEMPVEETSAQESIEEPEVTEPVAETPAQEPVKVEPVSDDPNKQLSPDEIAALFASAAPAPTKEEPEVAEEPAQEAPTAEEEKPFTPTFTVVGKDEPADTKAEEEPAPATPTVGDMSDPNKQLSPDEIAALFAAAEPAPKKEAPAPEPVKVEPVSDDPNKQLSPDEIAALFAAAEPAPKKEAPAPEPVKVEPISDDPNKQLSPDEIAALFASIG